MKSISSTEFPDVLHYESLTMTVTWHRLFFSVLVLHGDYLLIPGPGPAPVPPAGAPLLGLVSCPGAGGAETEAGAPAAGAAGPPCTAGPSPSTLPSFPIAQRSVSVKRGCGWFFSREENSIKLDAVPLPPSSPTIQHPVRSRRADGAGARWRPMSALTEGGRADGGGERWRKRREHAWLRARSPAHISIYWISACSCYELMILHYIEYLGILNMFNKDPISI